MRTRTKSRMRNRKNAQTHFAQEKKIHERARFSAEQIQTVFSFSELLFFSLQLCVDRIEREKRKNNK